MEYGGNEAWKEFFDEHELNLAEGRTFEDSTIKERYDGSVGEEWKARLAAKVEGREYVPGEEKKHEVSRSSTPSSSVGKRTSIQNAGSRLPPSRSQSPAKLDLPASRKEMNEAYFAKLGAENATRSADLPPSQGGKYGGFGGGMPPSPPSRAQQGGAVPGVNDFQNDPVGALTKGFGWFTTTLGKSAKTVNDSYLQPAAKQVCYLYIYIF